MKRIALLAVLVSVSSTAFANVHMNGTSINGGYNGTGLNGSTEGATLNGMSLNGSTINGLVPNSTVLNVERSSGLKAPRASVRNGKLFVR